MFLAIINDSYVEVKGELAKKKGEMTLMDWVRQVSISDNLGGGRFFRRSTALCTGAMDPAPIPRMTR